MNCLLTGKTYISITNLLIRRSNNRYTGLTLGNEQEILHEKKVIDKLAKKYKAKYEKTN